MDSLSLSLSHTHTAADAHILSRYAPAKRRQFIAEVSSKIPKPPTTLFVKSAILVLNNPGEGAKRESIMYICIEGEREREREKGDRCVYSIYYPRKYMLWECTGRASVCWLACESASVGARESGAVCGT